MHILVRQWHNRRCAPGARIGHGYYYYYDYYSYYYYYYYTPTTTILLRRDSDY